MDWQDWSPADIIALLSIIGTTIVAVTSQVYSSFLQERRDRKTNYANSLRKIFSAMQLYKMHVICTANSGELPVRSLLKKYESLYITVAEEIVCISSIDLVNNIWGVLGECMAIVDAGAELGLATGRSKNLICNIDNLCTQIDKQFKRLNSIKVKRPDTGTPNSYMRKTSHGKK